LVVSVSAFTVVEVVERLEVEEVRRVLEWARVRALAVDGARGAGSLGGWGSAATRSGGWSRRRSRRVIGAPAGSMLGPLEPVCGGCWRSGRRSGRRG
jgi:hypothetical protein